jgi:hypothetical protein
MSLQVKAKEHAKGLVTKVVGGAFGLVVAGGLMWFSPWVDRYIKPPKPLANFESTEGEDNLTVSFKNLSQNAKEMRWDFGDGSPLEVLPGDQMEVKHKFKKSNSYKVTLVVKNVADQEDKRESVIAVGVKPAILDLSIKADQPKRGPYTAPVTVKFTATSDLEATYEWDFGEGYQPGGETMSHTFSKPGKYSVRVRPVLGHTRGSPMLQEIRVQNRDAVIPAGAVEPAPGKTPGRTTPRTVTIDVFVRTQAIDENKQQAKLKMINLAGRATSSDVEETVTATPGYVIKSARLEESTIKKSNNVINLTTVKSDDGRSVKVKAQVSTPNGAYMLQGALRYQEELEGNKPNESTATLSLPGSVTLDLPPGRKLEFEIKQSGVTIFRQGQLPTIPANVNVEGRNYLISATLTGMRVTINAREVPRQFQPPSP